MVATGGLGDTIISLGVAAAVWRKTRMPVLFWSNYPEASELLLDHWVSSSVPDIEVQSSPFPGYDFYVQVSCLSMIHLEKNFKGFPCAQLEEMHLRNQEYVNSVKLDHIIRQHPYLDGALADWAVKQKFTRQSLPYAMLGLEQPKHPYRIKLTGKQFDWEPFITVHDGYDTTQPAVHRATKTWNIRHWAATIEMIKARFPHLMVLQIGSPSSRQIPGVDVSLIGKTTVVQALEVLSKSLLHIDGDSGLVHAAQHLGVQCVVMFGPTPADFFGYRNGNNNLQIGECRSCFWLHDKWLERCPLGKPVPECMDNITPDTVFDAAERRLNGEVG